MESHDASLSPIDPMHDRVLLNQLVLKLLVANPSTEMEIPLHDDQGDLIAYVVRPNVLWTTKVGKSILPVPPYMVPVDLTDGAARGIDDGPTESVEELLEELQ